MDQGVSLFIDPTGAETGGRVVKRTFKEIGDAAVDAQQKINRTTGVVQEAARSAEASFRVIAQQQDAMREKYDQVFAAQQRYARALTGINDAQRLGAITASQQIDLTIRETNALNAKINTMARLAQTQKESAQASVDKSTINPNRGADVAAYGAALDALQAKFDPLFAASLRYKNILSEIDNAQRVGAISASLAIDLRMKEKASMEAVIGAGSRLAAQQKQLADSVVQMQTVTPDRGADVAAYGAALGALQAKFDPLYAASKRYATVLEEIANAQRVGAISASQAIDLSLRERQAYEAAANAGERLASSQKAAAQASVDKVTISPDRAKDIDAYGKSLDELRQKYNPLYAAGQAYRQTVDEIKQAHKVGAISTDEMVAALGRERAAVRDNITAITGQNKALEASNAARKSNLSSLNASNIVAQFQDVGVTAAMGMSPLQIGLQQGTQMALVFEQMKASGQSMARTLLSAFTQLIGPISLITIGLTVGAAALIQYFSSVGGKTKTADDAIKQHAETIKSIKDAYGEAAKGLGDYVEKSQAEAAAAARADLKIQTDVLKDLTKEFSSSLDVIVGGKSSGTQISQKFKPFQDAIFELRASMKAGAPDFVTFRREVEEAVSADPTKLRKFGDELINSSAKASDAGRRVQSAKEIIAGLGQIAEQQISGVGELKNSLTELAQIAMPALTGADKQHQDALKLYRQAAAAAAGSEDLTSARSAYDAALARIDATNPTVLQDGRKVPVPTPESRPVGLGEDATSKLLSFSNVDVSPAIKGVNTLSQAVTSVGSAASQSVVSLNGLVQASAQSTSGVVDVTRQLNDAKRAQVLGFEQQGQQLRTFQNQLTDVKKTLEDAANIAPADVFGDNIAGGAEAIGAAVTNVQKLFDAMNNGQKGVLDVYDGLGKIRAQLIAMGGDSKAVDRFMDSLINANALVGNLESSVKSLSQSIMGIPNRTISIGIQQYQVPTASGGSKSIDVYGAGADMNASSYNVGGKTVGVYGGNGIYPSLGSNGGIVDPYDQAMMNLTLGYGGARAAGGPTDAGKTYLVGENGPELMKMSGPGQVTNTNSTAALLSGGRDTLSLIEDHLNSAVQELRIHTDYFETYESDFTEMITALKGIKTGVEAVVSAAKSSVSYSGSSSGSSGSTTSSKNGGFVSSSSSNTSNKAVVDYNSVYSDVNLFRRNGTGAIGYDTYNISPAVNGQLGIKDLHSPAFATGGQIMPSGEDQKVELFKRSKERVIIVDDNKVSDRRGGGSDPASSRSERPVSVTANFYGGAQSDARSRQQQMDEIRRTVQQAIRS